MQFTDDLRFEPSNEMERTILMGSVITIEGVNIVLQVVGIVLLVSVYKREENNTQGTYLLNLAASELLWNLIAITKETIILYLPEEKLAHDCIDIALFTGIEYNVILAMYYFTGDRLLHILLHARYEEYWDTRKSRILILVTWVCDVVISIVFALLCYFDVSPIRTKRTMIGVVLPSLMSIYLIFSIVTYLYMFNIYKKSERKLRQKISVSSAPSTYEIFRKSRFHVSIVIIGTYLLLTQTKQFF